jgi:hypothetical protein
VHKALGALGCVTNGSFRDLGAWAQGFQMIGGRVGPSHAHVHMVDFGKQVNVFGMQVAHDDVVHADYHGAVVIPADVVKKLPAAIDLIARRSGATTSRALQIVGVSHLVRTSRSDSVNGRSAMIVSRGGCGGQSRPAAWGTQCARGDRRHDHREGRHFPHDR